jgi:hypothetical protein
MGSTEGVARGRRAPQIRLLSASAALVVLLGALGTVETGVAGAATYFVRQTVGDDSNDGLSPATAWKHFSRLSPALMAGDTAFVGTGL